MSYFLNFLNWTYLGTVASTTKRTQSNLLLQQSDYLFIFSVYDTETFVSLSMLYN